MGSHLREQLEELSCSKTCNIEFEKTSVIGDRVYISERLKKKKIDLLVTYNLAGFELSTLTDGLAYNLLDCRQFHFIENDDCNNSEFLRKQKSVNMFIIDNKPALENVKIACCYLTYNHPEVVKEVLEGALNNYTKYGTDMYFYDSSDDDLTKNIIESYISNGAQRLFYIDTRHINTGDEKYIYALQKNGLMKKYDYLWICKDRMYLEERILMRMVKVLKSGCDLLLAIEEKNVGNYLIQR